MPPQADIVINGVTVKPNQVWRTRSGNPALIIIAPDLYKAPNLNEAEPIGLAMLWYDDIDKTFNISQIYQRLSLYIEELSAHEAMLKFLSLINWKL